MKKIKLISALILFLMPFTLFNVQANSLIDGKVFDVEMNVSKEGVITVVETIDLVFNGRNQGIYVYLPQKSIMTFEGTTKSFYHPIKNVKVLSNDEVSISESSEFVELIIGTAGTYITGPKQYKYSYEIHTLDLGLKYQEKPFDLFYMNMISKNWDIQFDRVDFAINFPEVIDVPVNVYATEQNLPVDFTVNGSRLVGSYEGLPLHEGLTVEIAFEDGYFDFPTRDYTLIPLIVIAAISFISIVMYPMFGKEFPIIETVEFKGPSDLSSAESGYVFRGHNSSDDIISLIVFWASKSYLKLVETDEDADNIEIHKLKDLKSENEAEIAIFNQLFLKSDVTSTKDLTMKFAPTIQYGVTHLADRFRKSKDKKIFDTASSGFKGFSSVMIVVGMALLGGTIGYRMIPMTTYFMLGGAVGFLIGVALVVLAILSFSTDGISTRSRSKLKGIPFVILYVALIFLSYVGFASEFPHRIVFVITAILLIVGLYFIANMGKRTQYGANRYGSILGLKRFIETAEIERIKMFAEETPSLFYDLLPFTYVLGLTDVWMKKFETLTIEQPDWYQTSTPGNIYRDIYMMNALNRSLNSLNTSLTSVPQPKVSTGGSRIGGGGGFGSSGGGGFGGGGFGGSGGGGW